MNKLWPAIAACVLLGGCDEAADSRPSSRFVPVQQPAPPAENAAGQPMAPQPAAQANPVGEPTPGVASERAQAGVGEKGRGYGGGIITEPVHQYFLGKDRITFEIEIPKAMQLFQAEHNRYPKDMAEFQRAILDPASIGLPELPEGDRYVYDAKAHELMVEHPQRGPAPQ